jgi:hypothetical protein
MKKSFDFRVCEFTIFKLTNWLENVKDFAPRDVEKLVRIVFFFGCYL